MPIPGLSVRTNSPQSWRHSKSLRRRLPKISFSKKRGGFGHGGKKLPAGLLKRIVTMVALGIAVIGIISIFMLAWIAKDLPNPNGIIDRSIALSTKIYDRTGETLLYDVHGNQKRTFVSLTEIPKYLKDATLTAEDRQFYQHGGISISGIIRSTLKNIFTGSKVGGSTLTQQLVKNAILSPEKTYTRKIREIILSYQIEKKFSKDEILQMYFNEIPYGSVAYGAEAAAQTYFGKDVKNLDLAECAVLAALPQAPTYYSPYGSHTDALFGRQQWILNSMADLGYITQADADKAKQEKIEFKQSQESIIAPHFIMYIKEYLTEKYGELAVEQGGMKVITTLDTYKQNIAEEVVKKYAETNAKKYNANNEALVALDPQTGQILAQVGSKNYFADPEPAGCTPGKDCVFDPQVDAVNRSRQPGSSFKPIVYAAAFKKGYTPETVLYDVNTTFLNYDGKDYAPKNYDLKEHGPVTIRQALAGSLNIPAVKTIYLTGVDNVIDLAQVLGYTTLGDRSRYGLSLVLGGGEVKLLQHANAFAVLAREGEWHPPVGILKVEDKDGNVLEEYKKVETKVLETSVARQINSILTDNNARAFIFGQSNFLTLGNRPVGAKTGTTNDYHDAWTIGFTPSLVAGVWVGNNNNQAMSRGADGSVVAAPIWHEFMARVLGNTPIETFTAPDPTTTDKPVLNGNITQGIKVKVDKVTGLLATNLTPESQVEERTYRQVHDILYYINKDDPQGPTPPDLTDPQYQRWEDGVAKWAAANNIISQDPPTQYDNTYSAADQPRIEITSPDSSQTITNRNFTATVSPTAPRGVKRVEYYLNDQLIGTAMAAPFSLNVYLADPNFKSGFYTLKAIAYDDLDNNGSASFDLNIQLNDIAPALTWVAPKDNATIKASSFPYTIKADVADASDIQKIDVYYTSNGSANNIATIQQFPANRLTSQWLTPPPAGSYQLYTQITNKDGYAYKSDLLNITIK